MNLHVYLSAGLTLLTFTVHSHINNYVFNSQPTPQDRNFVSFDVSMGMHDPYFQPSYKKLIKKLPRTQDHWFRFTGAHINPTGLFTALKEAYNKNRFILEGTSTRIPHVFHQIWVGPLPFPEKYKRWQKTWQSIPGWEYKLWTDKDVENFPLINSALYFNEKNYGARADMLRLEILYRFGGVYIDTDFECIKPEMFDVLNRSYDFYCGLTPVDSEALVINNAIIGSIPGHPIIKACIEHLPFHATNVHDQRMRTVMRGPGLLTIMTIRHMNKGHRDIVLPPSFLYPLGTSQMRRGAYKYLPFSEKTLDIIKKGVIKPETIAIHYWDGSWKRPGANAR